jgi:hypothetical protein
MRKRFAVVIGVAAVGVMALGAQTGAQTQAPTPRGQAPPTCKGKPATVVGTNGIETPGQFPPGFHGTPGPDVIVALGGSDGVIAGGDGNDLICGGKGADYLVGGQGNDTLLGQAGRDSLNGAGGEDNCEGSKGADHADLCEVEKSIEKSPPKHCRDVGKVKTRDGRPGGCRRT